MYSNCRLRPGRADVMLAIRASDLSNIPSSQPPSTPNRAPDIPRGFATQNLVHITMGRGIYDCPSEILRQIIDEVAKPGAHGPWQNPRRDLKACSYATKVLVPHARVYIFASITLSFTEKDADFDRWPRQHHADALSRMIDWAPDIASCIKHLRVQFDHKTRDSFDAWSAMNTKRLFYRLKDLDSLAILSLNERKTWMGPWKCLPPDLHEAFISIVGTTKYLKCLEINCFDFPFHMVNSCLASIRFISKYRPPWTRKPLPLLVKYSSVFLDHRYSC